MRLRIEKAVYGGSGLARAEGKAIFVPFTLPGEEVEARIVSDKGGFATAELESVVEPSPVRIEPPCQYFGRCGGCHYQHAAYAAQVEMKLAILRESLERAHVPDIPAITLVTAEPLGYRNRIRLHVRTSPFSLGYNLRNSREHLPVDNCPIAAPILQQAIQGLNREGMRIGIPQFATEIELFTDATESVLLLSFWTSRPASYARQFCDKMTPLLRQIVPQLEGIGVFAAEKNRITSRLVAHEGSESIEYRTSTHKYRVSLGLFFQVNRFLIDRIVELVTAGETGSVAWDLYAGVGLFLPTFGRIFPGNHRRRVVCARRAGSARESFREAAACCRCRHDGFFAPDDR